MNPSNIWLRARTFAHLSALDRSAGTERGLTRAEQFQQAIEAGLGWHRGEPVGDYERHRNAAIAELQGNRNPLIDRPEWAERILFGASFET